MMRNDQRPLGFALYLVAMHKLNFTAIPIELYHKATEEAKVCQINIEIYLLMKHVGNKYLLLY